MIQIANCQDDSEQQSDPKYPSFSCNRRFRRPYCSRCHRFVVIIIFVILTVAPEMFQRVILACLTAPSTSPPQSTRLPLLLKPTAVSARTLAVTYSRFHYIGMEHRSLDELISFLHVAVVHRVWEEHFPAGLVPQVRVSGMSELERMERNSRIIFISVENSGFPVSQVGFASLCVGATP